MSVFGNTAAFVYAQQNEHMMFGAAASGLLLKNHRIDDEKLFRNITLIQLKIMTIHLTQIQQ